MDFQKKKEMKEKTVLYYQMTHRMNTDLCICTHLSEAAQIWIQLLLPLVLLDLTDLNSYV